MATFVLVPGAFHGRWCWERITPLLEARGHRVREPELLGMGADATPLATVTLAKWADQIAVLLRAEPEPVLLLGHSRGGVIISEVAERVPERICRLIYLTALLGPDGSSARSLTQATPDANPGALMVAHENGTLTLIPGAVPRMLYNLTPEPWVRRALEQLGPEPRAPSATALRLTTERYGCVPRAYIECTEDRALPLGSQRAMLARQPCSSVLTLASDHSPFFSQPRQLVGVLDALAAMAPGPRRAASA